jgi:conjugal transfer pilin signal peptidase TrbI
MPNKICVCFFKIVHAGKTKINHICILSSRTLQSKLFLSAILALALFEIILFKFDCKLSINISASLPFKIFLVDARESSINKIKNGDYMQFRNDNTSYYGGENITKKVLAVGGDRLKINQYEIPMENIQAAIEFGDVVLEVKDYTTRGTKIHVNNVEIMPQNQYFVYGMHRDSFDSRYKEFGLIKKQEVIGVARPLF